MEETHSFFPLLIVIGLAFIVPLSLIRFRRLGVARQLFAGVRA